MALLYQPPKLPYAGTELGSGSNVYCKILPNTSLLNIGPGYTSSASVYLDEIKANWQGAGFTAGETYTTTGVVSGTSTAGSGFTARFAVTVPDPVPANGTSVQVTLIVVDPGYGYKTGADNSIFFDADEVLAKFNAGTTPEVAGALYTMDPGQVFRLQASTSPLGISMVVYAETPNPTGWQCQIGGPDNATSQLLTIVIPNASQNDIDPDKYAIVANATGRNGDKETLTQTVGVVSGSIARDYDPTDPNSPNTVTITVRRAAADPTPGAKPLLRCNLTVRLAKRELEFTT